jgi:rhamnose utilization protein RhaD (predicted bifunctional aldolase and dehydrogenase)
MSEMEDEGISGQTARLSALRQLSSRIGHNLDLVQAGGGNTSLKDNGSLWVKASGKWLVHAMEEDIFLPVPQADILQCMAENREHVQEYVTSAGAILRPSVETSMHVVLPHRVVVHVHSVNTIAWAVRTDAREAVGDRLKGTRWSWIPYVHPGLVLGQRIQQALHSKPDILILGNHGLVIGADDCIAAQHLLQDVEHRLENAARPAPAPDLEALARLAPPGWRIAPDNEVHALATDRFSLKVASAGVLFPDQCVYLGPALGRSSKVMLVPSEGVLVSDDFDQAGRELLIALKRVIERLDPAVPVRYIEDALVSKLMNWDAEKYRIAMAKQYDTLPHHDVD